ncbi:MAG: SMC-Scp complex subunit ScpB [Deltaproteobacteria bacterium]|nr:SMC-Scp complex subunit ScpB [Deltaproteobacteria bacterium]
MDKKELKKIIEALILSSGRPLPLPKMKSILEEGQQMTTSYLKELLDEMQKEYESERGIALVEVAGGYQFRTHARMQLWLKKLDEFSPLKMSRALVETLAIIAYKQPLTKTEIEDIRGVDSVYTLKTLLDANLVRISGKKEEVGHPLLYATTDYFLEFFNLKSLKDLPSLKDFQEIQVRKLDFANQLKSLRSKDEVTYDFLTGKQLPPPTQES